LGGGGGGKDGSAGSVFVTINLSNEDIYNLSENWRWQVADFLSANPSKFCSLLEIGMVRFIQL